MTITKRISELLQSMMVGIPERELYIQLAFLTMFIGEPFYLYGRAGSGKGLILERLSASFKNAKVLKMGKRQQELPAKLDSYDIIIFQNFDPTLDFVKKDVHAALAERGNASFIVAGDVRPEVALTRSDIIDKLALTVALPDTISVEGLNSLLTATNDVTDTHVPLGLSITAEERNSWMESIKKVTLSKDTLSLIGKLAELCDRENIYVSLKKCLTFGDMVKAIAFFNGRTETSLTDTFFLGSSIWGRTISNKAIVENYRKLVESYLLKDIPGILEERYDAENLIMRVNKLLKSSNNLYETKMFNNEVCLTYRVTIAGESTPLYVPLQYIETDGKFNPYNEFRQLEKRVLCDFHGTSNCSISIDSSVKGVGLRSSQSRNSSVTPGKFEDYATLPTHILRENDPEIIEQKRQQFEEIKKEIAAVMDRETKYLVILRETYKNIKKSKDELFCHQELYDKVQERIKSLFDETAAIISKVKEAHGLASQPFEEHEAL